MLNAETLLLALGVLGRALLITAVAGVFALIGWKILPKKMREDLFK